LDGFDDLVEDGEMPIVRCQSASELPNPLNGIEFGTVWGQKHEREHFAVGAQPRLEQTSVVVLGVVQYQDKALAARAVFE